jgi:hypothetical protein
MTHDDLEHRYTYDDRTGTYDYLNLRTGRTAAGLRLLAGIPNRTGDPTAHTAPPGMTTAELRAAVVQRRTTVGAVMVGRAAPARPERPVAPPAPPSDPVVARAARVMRRTR